MKSRKISMSAAKNKKSRAAVASAKEKDGGAKSRVAGLGDPRTTVIRESRTASAEREPRGRGTIQVRDGKFFDVDNYVKN